MDRACPAVLARLQLGPADTLELQAEILTTHVAKPIFDLRAAGYRITTRRRPNGVAVYELKPGGPVDAEASVGPWEPRADTGSSPAVSASSRTPVFGDPDLLRAMRPKGRRR